ncbi:MAG: flagellar biosynthesis anti-sigma factor FlgM [Vulcanibacillus sp.]
MEINNINSIQNIKKYQQINQNEKEVKKSETKKDQITISDEAKLMLEHISETSNVEKVERIKAQIENGTYQVDANLVAAKMLNMDISNSGE